MKNDETLRIYALRLQELGRKAYPHDFRKQINEIKQHLSEFSRLVQLTEDASRISQPGYKLSCSSVLELVYGKT